MVYCFGDGVTGLLEQYLDLPDIRIDGRRLGSLVQSAGIGATCLGGADRVTCQQIQADGFETRERSRGRPAMPLSMLVS